MRMSMEWHEVMLSRYKAMIAEHEREILSRQAQIKELKSLSQDLEKQIEMAVATGLECWDSENL